MRAPEPHRVIFLNIIVTPKTDLFKRKFQANFLLPAREIHAPAEAAPKVRALAYR